jgi:hypothetical protein
MAVNDTRRTTGIGGRIPHADRRELDRIAADRGVGISDVLREAIRRFIEAEAGNERPA